MEGHSRKHCEVKKAKEFLNEVKHRFLQDNRRDKYDDFLKVLKDYKTKRFDHVLPLFCLLYCLMGFIKYC